MAIAGYRIPDGLVQAFHEAIHQLDGWNWVGREPVVSLDEEDCRSHRSIGSIADYASIFDDPVPAGLSQQQSQTKITATAAVIHSIASPGAASSMSGNV